MHQRAVNRFSLVQELRGALDAGQLSMHYQPIADLATGDVVGFEALMRWHHPDRGWVLPGVFIPLAEQSDLILELGTFALRAAIAEAAAWEGDLDALPYVTVNLSGRQFLDPDLIPTIRGLLAEAELPPRRLVLEITESVALLDEATTMSVLARPQPDGRGDRPRRLRIGLLVARPPRCRSIRGSSRSTRASSARTTTTRAATSSSSRSSRWASAST